MPIEHCMYLREMSEKQREDLISAIDVNKWYLSEKASRDVGFETAKEDFVQKYLREWAEKFRKEYCGSVCGYSKNCEVYQDFLGKQKEKSCIT